MSEDPRRTQVDIKRRPLDVLVTEHRSLPDDLVDEALLRLGHVALVIAALLAANLAYTTLFARSLQVMLGGSDRARCRAAWPDPTTRSLYARTLATAVLPNHHDLHRWCV